MSISMAAVAASMAVVTGGGLAVGTGQGTHAIAHEHFVAVADSDTYRAVTYDTAAVPAGSQVTVVSHPASDGGTRVALILEGVQPDRTFGAHVHRNRCGASPGDSGSHYQNVPDPVTPSTDPAYANPDNEIWLDLTTDGHGDGHAVAAVGWRFRAGEAASVVVHEHATDTHPGHAGTAGARLACVDVPLS
ncbi:superoxide dismutase family protein [Streptomyces sp. B1866]|uniref:superoxide dismutase family protein n=1 Tax=Streptomyces sp. B1866 TaxID=3075431 RepID=UPI00288F4347|nr:superoxide dismutase family protein [Streptomyces sp. B1866]MDT3399811.1 superoxide dismutase family protein [Streptomyces sp. B1866]